MWHHRLQRTQNLLHESTKDFLQLKFEARAHEKNWMTEKDRLLQELDSCHSRQRKTGSAGAKAGQAWQPGSGTARPPKQELKVEVYAQYSIPEFLMRILFFVSYCY